ncbi:MAG: amidohydrolase family protein [Vicinamibacterales bacterium]
MTWMDPARAASWDAHAHVIGDPSRYPLAPGRGYTPAPAALDDYLAMLDHHGIGRGVLVQPSVYGHDHECLLDALYRANGRLRGIAVPAPDSTARALERLHAHGVRGIRCNLINPGGLAPAAVETWRPVLHALGWHVELQVPIADQPDWIALVESFTAGPYGLRVAIDHMGRPAPGHLDPASAPLDRLVALVRDGGCFVKLSAPYRLSAEPPPWRDVAPLARALVAANPAACLWASDWPHVDTAGSVRTGDLLEALDLWCPDEATRLLVTGAAAHRLYGDP